MPKTIMPIRDFKQDTGYRWQDRDEIMDFVVAAINESGLTYTQIANMSGVHQSTLRNWCLGKTKRPMRATLDIVLRKLNYEMRVYRNNRRVW